MEDPTPETAKKHVARMAELYAELGEWLNKLRDLGDELDGYDYTTEPNVDEVQLAVDEHIAPLFGRWMTSISQDAAGTRELEAA